MIEEKFKLNKIDVSFVIINYNGCFFLEQCLSSIQNSVSKSLTFEIIVVDDASTDGSVAMIREKFPSVHLIINDKESFSNVCLNKGIKAAKGEYVHFLMPDTLLTPGTVEKLVDFMKQRNNVGAVTCRIVYPDGRFQQNACRNHNLKEIFLNYTFLGKLFPVWKKKVNDHYSYVGVDWNKNCEIENIGFTNMLVRKTVFDKIGLTDLRIKMYFSENDFCMRMQSNGWKIFYVSEGKVVHHLRGVVKKSGLKKISKIYEKDTIQFVKKYYGSTIAVILRIFIWISNFLISVREKKPTRVTERFLVESENTN